MTRTLPLEIELAVIARDLRVMGFPEEEIQNEVARSREAGKPMAKVVERPRTQIEVIR